jgi:addiction module HigA family antidote
MASYPARGRKVAPPHPGAVAADILEENRISSRAAAKAIGLSANGMSKVLNGKGPVTPDTALKFGTYFGNGPDLWLRLQADYDLWHGREKLKSALAKIKPLIAER